MLIVKYQNFFLATAVLIAIASLGFAYYYGLNLGIDFTGGAMIEAGFVNERPSVEAIKSSVDALKLDLGNVIVQNVGDKDMILKMRDMKEAERTQIVKVLTTAGAEIKSFDSIGPVIGAELKQKAYIAVTLVCFLIALYIAFAFRKVSEPVSSFKYGVAAILALAHDVSVPLGVIAIMGHFYGTEADLLFVTALLAILGFSVHDTIVVFDRIRENLRNRAAKTFSETVGMSVSQTLVRSINTSMSTAIALLALYLLGGESTKIFSFILIIGIISGTYSSICIASPILLLFEKMQLRKQKSFYR